MDPALVRICFGNLTNYFIKINIANLFLNRVLPIYLKMIIANLSEMIIANLFENDYCQTFLKIIIANRCSKMNIANLSENDYC